MATWQDISNDPDYQGLPDTEKRKVADGFFSKTISADPDYNSLAKEEQDKVRFGFYAKTGFNVQDSAKESFMQKLGRVTDKMIGPDTAAGHMASDILRVPGTEKLTQPVFGAISKGIGKVQDAISGNPTAEVLASPFKTALAAGKGIADLMAPAGLGAADLIPIASKLRFLAKAPAAIRAVEIAKVEKEVGQKAFKAATEALTPEELSSITGTAEKAKAATSFVPPAGWKSTAPIGSAPAPTTAGKPFTLQAGLGANNQAALEAFRAKLPKGPEIPTPLPQAAPQAAKAAPVPVTAAAPVEAAGKGFAGNINLTKYPKPVADLISTANKSIGFAEREAQSIPELKAVGGTPEAQQLYKQIISAPEGAVPGAIANAREVFNSEAKVVIGKLDNILTAGTDDIQQLVELAKKGEEVSKSAKMAGQSLRVFQEAADSKLAQQLVDKAEELKLKAKATQSPLAQPYIDGLTALQKAISKKAFDLSQASRFYRKAMQVADQVYYVYLNAILSNPLTHIRNTAGNIVFSGMKPVEKMAAATYDGILSKLPGGVKAEHTLGEVGAQAKAAAKWIAGQGEKLPFDVAEAGGKLDVNLLEAPIGGAAGKVVGAPLALLKVEDDIAKSLIGQMEYAGLKARGLAGKELEAGVKAEALYRTFQQETGPAIKALISLRDSFPGVKYIVPFLKTPSQLFMRGAERSPLGFGKVAYKAMKGGYKQADMAADLGNATLGSTAAAFLAWQYSKGKITGSYPTDKTEREMWQAQGKTEYSMKVNGRWVPLARIEPIGSIVKIAVAGIDAFKNSEQGIPENKASEVAIRLGKELTSQSALNGFNNLSQALSDPERYAGKVAAGVSTGFIPGISKFAADVMDPYARAKQGVVETGKSKIPGLSKTLPPQRDVLGTPLQKDVFWGAKGVDTPELDFAKSLGVTLPDTKKVFQPLAPVSTEEQDKYRLFVGIRIKGLLQQEMQKQTYADPDQEKKFLENQMREYAETGRAITIANSELRDLGINISTTPEQAAYLYKNVLHDKRYKPLSKEQRREIVNRIILGGRK